jgi:hypothetical protein
MPVTYEIDRARNLVRTACVGFVTFQEVMAHFNALESDPRRAGAMDVLLDLRGLTSTPETGQLRRAAKRIEPEQTPLQWGVCALVATDPAAISTGKLFAVFARDRFRATTVVSSLEEADRWIELQSRPQAG